MNIIEMREKRAKLVNSMSDFLDKHRNSNGTLSVEDDAAYTKMEKEFEAITNEIRRQERLDAINEQMSLPTSTPITNNPSNGGAVGNKKAEAYKNSFWNMMRHRTCSTEVVNALQEGVDSEGGYLVPDEFDTILVEGLKEENIFRKIAHVIKTSSGDRKIAVADTNGTASWVDEEGQISESDGSFGQVSIGSHKLGTLVKVSNELLNDSAFNLEAYIAKEAAYRIGGKEEEAFFNGDGTGKPVGIFRSTGGADVGVTTASATDITADEIIDMFYSLKAPYRKNAVWTVNDSTAKVLRKMKDGNGNYMWQPALTDKAPDTLLGRPVYTSSYIPEISAGAKVIAFGDFEYYWIADRQARSIKKLNELYAANDQTGFVVTQRVDGKLALSEAIKVLQMHA